MRDSAVFINALSLQRYALYRNVKGTFEYVSGETGVGAITRIHSGWGARFVDYDNDGWKDLFVAQGHVMDNIAVTQPALRYLEPPLVMRNVRGKSVDPIVIRQNWLAAYDLATRMWGINSSARNLVVAFVYPS